MDISQWPRLLAAGLGLTTALIAVGYMIFRTSQLLTDEWGTLAQLDLEKFKNQLQGSSGRRDRKRREALGHLYGELAVYKDELYGHVADDIPDLYRALQVANTAARQNPESEEARRSVPLRSAAGAVAVYANYYLTRERFKALRPQLAWAAVAVAAGVVVFAYAANPKPKPAVIVPISDVRTLAPASPPADSTTPSHMQGKAP
ncbi:hypothetical protein ACGFNX_40355 [Streptomyces sp. NPDC048723]|uniref:hypothetical protein n=1 Tax=unclassified Streptomyces TaxID=2593676 RepID=UPI002E0F206D|nr:hypothetical protein OG332_47400 [Streptomyces sp. NBC_01233]